MLIWENRGIEMVIKMDGKRHKRQTVCSDRDVIPFKFLAFRSLWRVDLNAASK